MKALAVIALAVLTACGGGGDPAPEADHLALKSGPGTSTAIYVHGGGWVAGTPDSVRPLRQRFSAWGYDLGSADYRLIPDVTLADEVSDVRSEIARVRGSSTAPMVVVGHSAGAHLAATAVLGSEAGPVCLILLDGIGYDLPDLLHRRPGLQDRLTLKPEHAKPWSPAHLLDSNDSTVRVFIAAGNDARDTKGEGERLQKSLTAAGVSAEFGYYPDMDHMAFLSHFTEAPPSEFLKSVARFVNGCAWRAPI